MKVLDRQVLVVQVVQAVEKLEDFSPRGGKEGADLPSYSTDRQSRT